MEIEKKLVHHFCCHRNIDIVQMKNPLALYPPLLQVATRLDRKRKMVSHIKNLLKHKAGSECLGCEESAMIIPATTHDQYS